MSEAEADTSIEDKDVDYTPIGSQPSVGASSHVSTKEAADEDEPKAQQQASAKDVIDLEKEPVAKARKVMASRSDMWRHFAQVKNDANVVTHGTCNYCMRSIKADTSKHGTSSLKKHFLACKRNPHRNEKDPTQALLQTTPGEAPGYHKWDPEAVRQAFTEMVIEDELPFAFGEKSGFRKFMAVACPRFNVPNVYEKVFTKLADEDLSYKFALSEENDGYGCPDETDWENSKKMEEFLGHFFDVTTRVSASLSVTCNSFFHEIAEVRLLIQTWLDSEDALQVAMGHRMRDKFNKYWGLWHINSKGSTTELDKEVQNEKVIEKKGKKAKGKDKEKEKENPNLLIYVAAALDPRYKLSDYTSAVIEEIFGQESGQLVWTAINTCLAELFEEYRKSYAPTEGTSEVTADDQRAATTRRGTMLSDRIAKKLKMNNGASSNAKTELDKYLAEACEEAEVKFDILGWWKLNAHRFPVLAALARDVLAIPLTSVASESAFSTGGRILDDFRTSLTPFMLEALVCTQDWLRRTTPIDIQENMEELAKMEKGK
jgi:hypothetical protein